MADVLLPNAAIARSAMRKALWHIVPLIALAYLCAYMDRVNISFAASQMNVDLNFSATIYGLGGCLFFLGYALFEVPSNLFLIGAFVTPIAWGVSKDATGGFQAGLMGLFAMTLVLAALLLLLRRQLHRSRPAAVVLA